MHRMSVQMHARHNRSPLLNLFVPTIKLKRFCVISSMKLRRNRHTVDDRRDRQLKDHPIELRLVMPNGFPTIHDLALTTEERWIECRRVGRDEILCASEALIRN